LDNIDRGGGGAFSPVIRPYGRVGQAFNEGQSIPIASGAAHSLIFGRPWRALLHLLTPLEVQCKFSNLGFIVYTSACLAMPEA